MLTLHHKRILVIGLGLSGVAACEHLLSRESRVWALDAADTPELRQVAARLRQVGVNVRLGPGALPEEPFDLAVISPGVPLSGSWPRELQARGIPIIGELELAFQQALCLNIAISGSNGKTTTTELVAAMLRHNRLKTVAAGNIGRPFSAVIEETRELDFITLEVSSFQLETIQLFRPAVAVLLNITPDHLDRYPGMREYIAAKARLFENQRPFDWAIVQSEALALLRASGVEIRAKTITFSAQNRRADLFLDRGLIISRLPDWEGPLLDMDKGRLRGPHNAENLMASLAVGRVLRLPLQGMVAALSAYQPAPHRCEFVAEVEGVRFVNDSKATNLDAVHKALLAMPAGAVPNEPNIWLLAGGKDKGFEYHDIGPLLSQRVKGAFLFGETREKIRAAWSLFTPCAPVSSLLEAVTEAATRAIPGDVVLLSPACSSFDQFQNYQHRGEVFREAVKNWAASRASEPSQVVPGTVPI